MLSINCQKVTQQIVKFLRQSVKKAGFKKVIIASSGGVDSSTVLFLAVKALGKSNVYALRLPYGKEEPAAVVDSDLVVGELKLSKKQVITIDIQPTVDVYVKAESTMDNLRRGNIMARMRMIVLFDYAKKLKALVLGTENKSEHLLGYYTRFGDEASDLEPLRHLYKTQVRQLATYLGVPAKIINKVPSAGLWQGQTDEGEFGFSYQIADRVLDYLVDNQLTAHEVVSRGIKKTQVDKVIKWLKKMEFKQHLPISLVKS